MLSDPLIEEALQSIEEVIIEQWMNTSDTSVREELWYTLSGMKHFTRYFRIAIEQGTLEKHNLDLEKEG
jgi:hypothetical protein